MPATLTIAQINIAAGLYNLDPLVLRAVLQVESSGVGFLPDGHVKILLERHILWERILSPDHGQLNPHALYQAHPDICNPTVTPPGGYGPESAQWSRLETVIFWAQNHDPAHVPSYTRCAYEACSWGLAQILGENYASCGYPDVDGFVADMKISEATQLDIMLRWVSHNGLLTRMKQKDWTGFARGYNGPGAVMAYSGKLISAYKALGGK